MLFCGGKGKLEWEWEVPLTSMRFQECTETEYHSFRPSGSSVSPSPKKVKYSLPNFSICCQSNVQSVFAATLLHSYHNSSKGPEDAILPLLELIT